MSEQPSPRPHHESRHRDRSGLGTAWHGRAPSTVKPKDRRAEHDHGVLFRDWLTGAEYPDTIVVEGASLPMTCFLGGLVTSPAVLPAAATARLGLPAGTRIGQAATELVLAVKDPAGPRCGSYRSAVSYLRGLFRDPGVPDGRGTAATETSHDCDADEASSPANVARLELEPDDPKSVAALALGLAESALTERRCATELTAEAEPALLLAGLDRLDQFDHHTPEVVHKARTLLSAALESRCPGTTETS
jgi:hypothetical protein